MLEDARGVLAGRLLYEEVAAYFEATGKLVSEAHKIAEGCMGATPRCLKILPTGQGRSASEQI